MASLYWVDGSFPGRLAVAERPRGGPWMDDDLRAMKAAGVTMLVSALGEKERRETQLHELDLACASAGVAFRGMPLPNLLTPDLSSTWPLLEEFADEVRGGGGLAAHCHAGIGRSPLIVASVLVVLGVAAKDAWTKVEEARGRAVPDTVAQRRWVHDLEAHVRQGASLVTRISPA